MNTLEYLQKGGRIGKVHSLLGSLLNVKPVVRVGDDGIYHTYTKARQRKALKAIVKAFQELARGENEFNWRLLMEMHSSRTILKRSIRKRF